MPYRERSHCSEGSAYHECSLIRGLSNPNPGFRVSGEHNVFIHASHSLNSLQGVIWGIRKGTSMGIINGDTRSLDTGSCDSHQVLTWGVWLCQKTLNPTFATRKFCQNTLNSKFTTGKTPRKRTKGTCHLPFFFYML